MKKELIFIFMFLLTFLNFSLIQAETISNETEKEIVIMENNLGAEIRLLQLEKNIHRMTLHAENIINYISEKGNETEILENILEEMKLLLEETKTINLSDLNHTIQDFINIKEDALALRKEFKETASIYLSSEDKFEIRKKLLEIDRTQLKEYKERIRERIREYNVKRIEKFSEITGLGKNLSEKIREKELNSLQAWREIKKEYLEKEKKERKEIRSEIKEKIKHPLKKASEISKFKQKRAEKLSERAEKRAEKLSKRGFPVLSARKQTRAELLKTRAENIETVRNAIKQRIKNSRGSIENATTN